MATCGWGAQNLVQLNASHLKKPKQPYFHFAVDCGNKHPLFYRYVGIVSE